jgi:hypothetical protein
LDGNRVYEQVADANTGRKLLNAVAYDKITIGNERKGVTASFSRSGPRSNIRRRNVIRHPCGDTNPYVVEEDVPARAVTNCS